MGTITVEHRNCTPVEMYYEDQGAGQPAEEAAARTAGRNVRSRPNGANRRG